MQEAEQHEVDALYGLLRAPAPLPKGQSGPTMGRIREILQSANRDVSASEIAEQVGISRSTAQRYLAELARQGKIELHLHYGTTGRPEHRYRIAAAMKLNPQRPMLARLRGRAQASPKRPPSVSTRRPSRAPYDRQPTANRARRSAASDRRPALLSPSCAARLPRGELGPVEPVEVGLAGHGGDAAVDHEVVSGDVRGVVRREE
jgi:biotin operon repressor